LVVIHRIIAVEDYVWTHVHFINLFNYDPFDRRIAGVDIFKMDTDSKAIEHWRRIAGDWRSGERRQCKRLVLICAGDLRAGGEFDRRGVALRSIGGWQTSGKNTSSSDSETP